MDSLESVQKSHQEQIDNQRISIQGLVTENISLLSQREELKNQLRKAEYPVRVLYVPVDTDKVAALEKQLDDQNIWNANQVEMIVGLRAEIKCGDLRESDLRAKITDLEKQLAEKTRHADNGWARAHEVSVKCDKAQNKLDAIKKLLDSREAMSSVLVFVKDVKNILGGN